MIEVRDLQSADYKEWQVLARGYRDFYNTPTSSKELEDTWARLMDNREVFGLGATLDNQLVGITHYLYHATVWTEDACYLQDLFTHPDARGKGVARQLIRAVAVKAAQKQARSLYWLTQEDNTTARLLYDKVARFGGFIRYEHNL